MALQKDYTTEVGVTGNYWRITQVTSLHDINKVHIHIVLYLSRAGKEQGNLALAARDLDINGFFHDSVVTAEDVGSNMADIILKHAYDGLKSAAQAETQKPEKDQLADLAYFADAVDVFEEGQMEQV